MVPCAEDQDTCIIFGKILLKFYVKYEESLIPLENIETEVPTDVQKTFCEGVSNCSVTQMSKVFQGCINLKTFLDQV